MWRSSCCVLLLLSCRPARRGDVSGGADKSFFVGRVVPLSELSGSLFPDSSDLRSIRPRVQHFFEYLSHHGRAAMLKGDGGVVMGDQVNNRAARSAFNEFF